MVTTSAVSQNCGRGLDCSLLAREVLHGAGPCLHDLGIYLHNFIELRVDLICGVHTSFGQFSLASWKPAPVFSPVLSENRTVRNCHENRIKVLTGGENRSGWEPLRLSLGIQSENWTGSHGKKKIKNIKVIWKVMPCWAWVAAPIWRFIPSWLWSAKSWNFIK